MIGEYILQDSLKFVQGQGTDGSGPQPKTNLTQPRLLFSQLTLGRSYRRPICQPIRIVPGTVLRLRVPPGNTGPAPPSVPAPGSHCSPTRFASSPWRLSTLIPLGCSQLRNSSSPVATPSRFLQHLRSEAACPCSFSPTETVSGQVSPQVQCDRHPHEDSHGLGDRDFEEVP